MRSRATALSSDRGKNLSRLIVAYGQEYALPVKRAALFPATAVLLATGVLAAACGAGGASAHSEQDRAGSVPACTATALRALQQHATLTDLPGPCRGLSRAQLNLALGRAI
jgi:hypothetical protein